MSAGAGPAGEAERPSRIVLVGPAGAGKTAAGRLLAARLGWPFVDTDQEVERAAGRAVAEIFAAQGEAAFRALEREAVARALELPRAVIATGGGAVLDPGSRCRMLARGFVVCLVAEPAALAARAAREGIARRPLLATGDPEQAARRLLQQRAAWYAQAHARIATDRLSPAEVAEAIYRRWLRGLPQARYEIPFPAAAPGPGGGLHAIWVGPGTAARAGELLAAALGAPPRAALLVADGGVGPLHGPLLREALALAGFAVAEAQVPPGEGSKCLECAADLYRAAAAARLERGDPVVALGGGMVGDLAGFVAATYLRGVPWAAVPTTLLAQVDAAIGGKTAINLPEGKNLVGAFHPPRVVACDTALLATLPEEEWRSGLAECVKHGAIADGAYFARLERTAELLLARDPDAVFDLVAGSVAVKARIVSQDPYEQGSRALLNFGHTIGHALEAVLDYRGLRHGEAVAAGMAVAADLSVEVGLLEPAARDRLLALLARLGLPVRLPPVDAARLLAAAALDKKRRGGRLRWVLLEEIGRAVVRQDVPEDLVLAVLRRRGAR